MQFSFLKKLYSQLGRPTAIHNFFSILSTCPLPFTQQKKSLDIYNEEHSAKQCGLGLGVKVKGEGHSKVVCISEDFLGQARPLLGDLTHKCLTVFGWDLVGVFKGMK